VRQKATFRHQIWVRQAHCVKLLSTQLLMSKALLLVTYLVHMDYKLIKLTKNL
jgi:hypothetical protein